MKFQSRNILLRKRNKTQKYGEIPSAETDKLWKHNKTRKYDVIPTWKINEVET